MSTNLNVQQLSGGMANPETAVNTATGQLDAAFTEILVVDLTNNVTLSSAQYRSAMRFDVTPSGVGKTLTLPAVKRLAFINNTSANDISIATGTTVLTLATGAMGLYYTDGTANGLIALNFLSAQPHDLHAFFPGKPAAAATILRFDSTRTFTMPASLTGSYFKAITAATGSSVFTLKKNGSSIGTLTFAAAATSATISFSSSVTFSPGDIFTIDAPNPQDATLSDLSFNFFGTR